MVDLALAALADLTTGIVAAYVTKNSVRPADVPALIESVHTALGGLGKAPVIEAAPEPLKPFVPIKKSVTEDYIISLEDGRRFKTLRRYLGRLGMTPDQYREKWGLPHDYPMVAPAYAAQRSALAKTIGLGRKAATAAKAQAEQEPAATRRGRPKKAA